MKLTLEGHDRVYPVEQSLLNYFAPETEGAALSRLRQGKRWQTATACIETGGKRVWGMARAVPGAVPDAALKFSFYRAVCRLMPPPAWGALTGIRPAKKALQLWDAGHRPARALQTQYDVAPAQARLAAECAACARALRDRLDGRDISLYIGIPFCPTRCAYCSFISASAQGVLIPDYVERLRAEIARAGAAAARLGLRVRTLYWGGGTPTVLSPDQLDSLLSEVRNNFDLSQLWEHTVEAGRPDTVTPEKLRVLRQNGVGRISVNPQTLSDTVLRNIGRAHTAGQFYGAYRAARDAGFDTINTDLIAGLPGDTPEGFGDTLDGILALRPHNITVHTLAQKKGSRVMEEGLAPRDAAAVEAMLDRAEKTLRGAGYRPYYLYRQKFTAGGRENVGWTLPGQECLYNLCMMEELSTVLALGAGGVSKFVNPSTGHIARFFQCKYPLEYLGRCDKIENNVKSLARFYG